MDRRTHFQRPFGAALTATLALAGTAIGQSNAIDPVSARGAASTWPAGVLFRDAALSGVRLKGIGDQTAPPAGWVDPMSAPNVPDYSLSTFFRPAVNAIASTIEYDAISTGNALIPTPVVDGVPPLVGSWLAASVSIADGGRGTPGSIFRDVDLATGHAGSEVVTFYLSDSQGLAPGLAGSTTLETSRTHMGLPTGGSEDLSGLDYGLGLQSFNPSIPEMVFFRQKGLVFFSVTKEWADLPAHQNLDFALDHLGVAHPPNGTDVYLAAWDPSTSSWFGPFLYASGDALGFDRGAGDLDALDVDVRNRALVYSHRVFPGNPASYVPGAIDGDENQLMIVELVQAPSSSIPPNAEPNYFAEKDPNDLLPLPHALYDIQGDEVSVAEKAGVGDDPTGDPDDVDGVCTWDPDAGKLAPEVGTPVWSDSTLGDPLGLSVVRRDVSPTASPTADSTQWTVQVTGWGPLTPQPLRVGLWRCDHTGAVDWTSPPPPSAWSVVGVALRGATEDAVSFEIDAHNGTPHDHASLRVLVYPATGGPAIGASWISSLAR